MAGKLKRAAAVPGMLLLVALAGCASSGPRHLKATVERQREADQAYDSGNLALALSDYQALTRDVPQHADFWFRLGNIHVRLQRPDDAVEAYRHALQIEPGHAKAWHNLGIVRLRQAEAAFGQSARYATGVDAPLQQQSAQMAHGIAGLVQAPAAPEADGNAGAASDGRQP
ncbi:MAG: tetratricopeptide repeat protein [Rhodanobacter sp.]